MYILVHDDVPLGFAMVAAAHASLAGYLKFQDDPDTRAWLSRTFFKAVGKANDKEFDSTKQVPDHVVLTESALGDREVAIVFDREKIGPRCSSSYACKGTHHLAQQAFDVPLYGMNSINRRLRTTRR